MLFRKERRNASSALSNIWMAMCMNTPPAQPHLELQLQSGYEAQPQTALSRFPA